MPIRTAVWKVSSQPTQLVETSLATERLLEDMIVAEPSLLSDAWMLVGRQERTGTGGIIDLLALAPDAGLVLIELKRDRTPREVVAQALDYATWVEGLEPEDIANIYARFRPGRNLSEDFQDRFGSPLDEESLNASHQIVIVAGQLDESSERIVGYLNRREIAINVLCFQVFENAGEQLLSRAWLIDPLETQGNVVQAAAGPAEPWNGEFYVSYGDSAERSWSEARHHGFICGGGGAWYSRTLKLLGVGDRVWVNIPKKGYVGVGRVTGKAVQARDFRLRGPSGEAPALEVLTGGTYHRQFVDDPERAEWFVPVAWERTVAREDAIQEVGFFGNQNTVCKPSTPKWRNTVERLKAFFGVG